MPTRTCNHRHDRKPEPYATVTPLHNTDPMRHAASNRTQNDAQDLETVSSLRLLYATSSQDHACKVGEHTALENENCVQSLVPHQIGEVGEGEEVVVQAELSAQPPHVSVTVSSADCLGRWIRHMERVSEIASERTGNRLA